MIPEPVPYPSWGYQDIAIFLFLSMIALLLGQVAVAGAARLMHVDPKTSTALLLPSQLLLYALVFAILFVIIKLQYGRGFRESLAWVPSRTMPAGGAVFMGFVLAFLVAVAAKLLRTPDVDSPMKHLLEHRSTALEFGLIGISIGPLCEELVFRGFLQPVVVRSFGRLAGILITAAVFGALHLAQNSFVWQSGVLIMFAGAAFGLIREFTGSTRSSTYMHMAYNSTFFIGLLSRPDLYSKP